jgi:tripartite-type tricarboxylate transporter receptor subunit TctC
MIHRRSLLGTAALLPLPALAQGAWPQRNITMIVPFPPGGQADLAARPIAPALQRILGRPVAVENRGGAGGAIGHAATARAAPDGYTIMMTLSSLVWQPESDRIWDRRPSYEVNQLAPIARVLADPTVLACRANAPWRSIQELIEDARRRPDAITYGSSGNYGTTHVCMEQFALAAGLKFRHVPYRGGGPALTGLLTGEIDLLPGAPGPARPHVQEGTFRILAGWGNQRVAVFPQVPTFMEIGLRDVEFYIWAGLFTPAGLPAPVTARLREAMREAMAAPEVRRSFDEAGSPPAWLDQPEFIRFIEQDSARLIEVVRRIGRVE